MTVKEYADLHGVTIQAVYQQMNRKKNKAFLQEHVWMQDGVKHLDDVAVKFLERGRGNSPSVIVQTGNQERIEELERENKLLLQKVASLQEQMIQEMTRQNKRIEELTDRVLLLSDTKSKRNWKFWEK